MTTAHAPVAIVHDYLTQRGGAERVVLATQRAFPDAAIHTSLYDAAGTFPEFESLDVRPALIDGVAPLRQRHRAALPFYPPTFSAMNIDADVVFCSSSGWAHGVRTRGRKVVYCHGPARWLYQTDAYLMESGRATTAVFQAIRPALRSWDQRAARSADHYVVNSNHTRRLVRDAYGIDAEVLHPPPGVSAGGSERSVDGVEPGFFLCVSRLLGYKHVGAVIEAFRSLGSERLVVVGSGPDEMKLRALAGPNVTFLMSVPDDQLRWLYAHADALIAASFEDFGLTPIEAASFGAPTIALRFGGFLDSVVEGETGIFFDRPEPKLIVEAIRGLDDAALSAAAIREHALGLRRTELPGATARDRGEMSDGELTISVVIPLHDGAAPITETLDSLANRLRPHSATMSTRWNLRRFLRSRARRN